MKHYSQLNCVRMLVDIYTRRGKISSQSTEDGIAKIERMPGIWIRIWTIIPVASPIEVVNVASVVNV